MTKREEARKAKAQAEADKWNEANPMGATVEFVKRKGFSKTIKTRTIGEAYVAVPEMEAVVLLSMQVGPALLSHCTVIPAGVAEPETVGGE